MPTYLTFALKDHVTASTISSIRESAGGHFSADRYDMRVFSVDTLSASPGY